MEEEIDGPMIGQKKENKSQKGGVSSSTFGISPRYLESPAAACSSLVTQTNYSNDTRKETQGGWRSEGRGAGELQAPRGRKDESDPAKDGRAQEL